MNFRINDVRNFIATASCRTIIEASQKLEISQPALSESLKRLEEDAGASLFYRSRSGVQLTPSGRLFLKKAERLLSCYNDLNLTPEHGMVFSERVISIGCHPIVAQYALPISLKRLKQNAPDYQIELKHNLSRNIQLEVQRGSVDVGIVVNPSSVPDLIIQKLAEDEVSVWTAKKDYDADTVICNLSLFQSQSILKKWKGRPTRLLSSDSLELVCQLVNEGIGFGILPSRAVRLSRLNLRNHTSLPTYKDTIALVYRPEFGKALPEKLVLDSLRQAFL